MSARQRGRIMPFMDWKQAIERWRALPREERVRIRRSRIPLNVAESMAFEGEPVEAEGRLLFIHPFADFNGRATRVWLREILRRLDLPPVQLAPEEKPARDEYLNALRAADRGDWRPLTQVSGWNRPTNERTACYNDCTGCVQHRNDHARITGARFRAAVAGAEGGAGGR